MIWEGEVNPYTAKLNDSVLLQRQDDIEAFMNGDTNMTNEDRANLEAGDVIVAGVYDEMFCCLFGIDY